MTADQHIVAPRAVLPIRKVTVATSGCPSPPFGVDLALEMMHELRARRGLQPSHGRERPHFLRTPQSWEAWTPLTTWLTMATGVCAELARRAMGEAE